MEREKASGNFSVRWTDSPILWSCIFFALAWTLRLLALNFFDPHALGHDESFYIQTAKRYAIGRDFSNKFFMPGWPWILSWFARFDTSVFFLRHCPVLLGSITVVLVYHLGRKVFSEQTGRIAALAMAVFPDHLLASGMLYAEPAIEACTVAVTLYAFWQRPWKDWPARDMIASFFFGAVVLVKHFIGVNFGGFLFSRSYTRRPALTILALCLCFFAPIVLHGTYMGMTGRDPFAVINSPLKSATEWGNSFYIINPSFTPGKTDRVERIKQHLEWLRDRPIDDTVSSIRTNLENLWSPSSFGIKRMLSNDYGISPGYWLVDLHLVAYAVVLLAGTFGMAFGAPSPFRRYSILSLVFLTSMSFGLYMVTRYRVSFFFVFFVFGADVAVQFPAYLYNVRKSGFPQRLGFAAAVVFFAAIFAARINHLTAYQ